MKGSSTRLERAVLAAEIVGGIAVVVSVIYLAMQKNPALGKHAEATE